MTRNFVPMNFWINHTRRLIAALTEQLENTPKKKTYLRVERQQYLNFKKQDLARMEAYPPGTLSATPI